MDTWIVRCKRRAQCKYCDKPIYARSTMVKTWWKKRGRWGTPLYWHPECWIEWGESRLEPLRYSDEELEQRRKLWARRGRLKQRIREVTSEDKSHLLPGILEKLRECESELRRYE